MIIFTKASLTQGCFKGIWYLACGWFLVKAFRITNQTFVQRQEEFSDTQKPPEEILQEIEEYKKQSRTRKVDRVEKMWSQKVPDEVQDQVFTSKYGDRIDV